ncbi:class I SAM-dependent methyltransferase [Gracilimonas sp.]|uniref:class I SAM-dependent methyltransferase n=1 Tax=Gracilimonas sp. TaxID=1974203 RepID=UPI0032EB536B
MSEKEFAENLRHPFGESGKAVAEFMKSGNKYMYDHVLTHFEKLSDVNKIIEIGCADGSNSLSIIERSNANYIGIDKSGDMIKLATDSYSNHPKSPLFYKGSAESFSKISESADLIFMVNVIYFINDLDLLFKHSKKVLNRGLLLICYKSSRQLDKSWSKYGFNFYTDKDIYNAALKSGFKRLAIDRIKPGDYNSVIQIFQIYVPHS